jgi:hypothetical protein
MSIFQFLEQPIRTVPSASCENTKGDQQQKKVMVLSSVMSLFYTVELFYGFRPRPEQIDHIKWLLYEGKNLTLVAKPSFGRV